MHVTAFFWVDYQCHYPPSFCYSDSVSIDISFFPERVTNNIVGYAITMALCMLQINRSRCPSIEIVWEILRLECRCEHNEMILFRPSVSVVWNSWLKVTGPKRQASLLYALCRLFFSNALVSFQIFLNQLLVVTTFNQQGHPLYICIYVCMNYWSSLFKINSHWWTPDLFY